VTFVSAVVAQFLGKLLTSLVHSVVLRRSPCDKAVINKMWKIFLYGYAFISGR